jgi:ABC-type phosphate transport system substrate-binding protein
LCKKRNKTEFNTSKKGESKMFRKLLQTALTISFLMFGVQFSQGALTVVDCPAPGGTGSYVAVPYASGTTICVNAGGSSAITDFASMVPVTLFKYNNAVNVSNPSHFISGFAPTNSLQTTSVYHAWVGILDETVINNLNTTAANGNVALAPGTLGIIRYTASGSSDGIKKFENQTTFGITTVGTSGVVDPTSAQTSLDVTNPLCASGPTAMSNGTYYWNEYETCTGTTSVASYFGAADVNGATIHQTGPLGTSSGPFDQTALASSQIAYFPFAIVTGNGLTVGVNPVNNLTREQIVSLFSGNTNSWANIGVTSTVSGVTLCMRNAGSGTKAQFQASLLKNDVKELAKANNSTTNGVTARYNSTTQAVLTCIATYPNSIGYAEVDQANLAGANIIGIDGNAPTKVNVQNGSYPYFASERLNNRGNTGAGASNDANIDPQQQSLIDAFILQAGTSSVISSLPTVGVYWSAPADMCVTRNADPGFFAWTKATANGVACPH